MKWITILLFAALVATQVPGSFNANASPASGCDRWVIAIIPAGDECSLAEQAAGCQPPEGWEPVSGMVYGDGGKFGVLLRRCVAE